MTVVTGSGADNIGILGFTADNVVVNTGSGNDGSPIQPEAPINNLQPSLFSGPVSVQVGTITNALVVTTGNGNDLVDIDHIDTKAIVVDTGAGNDGDNEAFPIEIDNCTVSGDVVLNTGSGNDVAEVTNELDEIDRASGQGIISGSLIVNMGAGNDVLNLGDSSEDEDLDVLTNLIVIMGSGNDFVDLENGTIGLITNINMGAGNDELNIFGSGGGSANAILIADGGPGRDTFNNDLGIDSNGNFAQDANGTPHEIIRNFEFFNTDDLLTVIAKSRKGGW